MASELAKGPNRVWPCLRNVRASQMHVPTMIDMQDGHHLHAVPEVRCRMTASQPQCCMQSLKSVWPVCHWSVDAVKARVVQVGIAMRNQCSSYH